MSVKHSASILILMSFVVSIIFASVCHADMRIVKGIVFDYSPKIGELNLKINNPRETGGIFEFVINGVPSSPWLTTGKILEVSIEIDNSTKAPHPNMRMAKFVSWAGETASSVKKEEEINAKAQKKATEKPARKEKENKVESRSNSVQSEWKPLQPSEKSTSNILRGQSIDGPPQDWLDSPLVWPEGPPAVLSEFKDDPTLVRNHVNGNIIGRMISKKKELLTFRDWLDAYFKREIYMGAPLSPARQTQWRKDGDSLILYSWIVDLPCTIVQSFKNISPPHSDKFYILFFDQHSIGCTVGKNENYVEVIDSCQ